MKKIAVLILMIVLSSPVFASEIHEKVMKKMGVKIIGVDTSSDAE